MQVAIIITINNNNNIIIEVEHEVYDKTYEWKKEKNYKTSQYQWKTKSCKPARLQFKSLGDLSTKNSLRQLMVVHALIKYPHISSGSSSRQYLPAVK